MLKKMFFLTLKKNSFWSKQKWNIVRKENVLVKVGNNSLVDLPTPVNLSNFWNFGSVLGIFLAMQILTGLLLASHYCSSVTGAFNSIIHIMQDVNYGWLIRIIHLNGASFFFIGLYFHVGRGLYYASYTYRETWNIGVVILFLSMMAAFLGYVLPWGQMSFWGATVITNFLSAVPIVGQFLVQWVWGGFAVESPTLSRFFMLHFCVPFIILGLVGLHLFFLHLTGSHNPLGLMSKYNTIPFHWFFSSKDVYFFLIMFIFLGELVFIFPFWLGDPENFILANPLVTPVHIVPEWYFLFAYGILRAIPNKLLGVVALVVSIAILFLAPFSIKKTTMGSSFRPMKQFWFFLFLSSFFVLTWLGGQVVEEPFVTLSQIFVAFYFSFYFLFLMA